MWELAGSNYAALERVQLRKFDYNGFSVFVQFNPARMVSAGAKVDAASIAARPCFLCSANRPDVQQGIGWRDYELLVNPFPIFSRHLTIPLNSHQPQSLLDHLEDMLQLARLLPGYSIFYNGPRCGASAPDHMHFQATYADNLPLISDYVKLKSMGRVMPAQFSVERNDVSVYTITDYLRTVYCVEFAELGAGVEGFGAIYDDLLLNSDDKTVEPMMSVVVTCGADGWRLFVMPRKRFRPWQFDAEGDARLLISPGTVEMSGIFITPCEEHFHRITSADIKDIYAQVCSLTQKNL